MTLGALILGVLNGLLIGLLAVGLVLVYKANRFLNLAHAQMGALSALLLAKFVIDWGFNWWWAFLLSVGIGVLTGLVVERGVVRRLRRDSNSPVRLLLVTIGVAQLLLALTFIPAIGPDREKLATHGYPLPLQTHFTLGRVVLSGQYVLIIFLAPLLVLALAVFLRRTTLGKTIRAAASNADEARLCGISVNRVSAVTWAMAGGLSAVSAVLRAPSQGSFNAAAFGPQLLLLALGAAALGSFVSIPAALIGGLGLGVAQQLASSETGNGGTALLIVFGLILLMIFARGRAIGDTFDGEGVGGGDLRVLDPPANLRDSALVRYQRAWLVAASSLVAVLFPLLPYFRPNSRRFELVLVVIYAMVGVAVTMLVGWGGNVSLGHFALVGVGAFLAARFVARGWSLPALLLLAGTAGAMIMAVIGLPALRVKGLGLAVTTLGLAVVAPSWLFRQSWFGSAQPFGVQVGSPPLARGLAHPSSQLSIYYVALVVLGLTLAGARALRRSAPGRLAIAVRDNEPTAAAFGITPGTVKLSLLALSGFVAAVAGVLWAVTWGSVSAGQFDPGLSLSVLAVPVIGGLGSLGGAVAGAVALYMPAFFVSPLLTSVFGEFGRQEGFQLALGGAGLVGVLLAYPNGIAGATERAWERLLSWMAAAPHRQPIHRTGLALEVQGVDLRFGGVQALNGTSMSVKEGEIVGLLGPNGAGKTTLINVISGVLHPDAGSVRLDGREMIGLPVEYRAACGLARSFQGARLFPGLTVTETIQVAQSFASRVGVLSSVLSAPWARSTERATRSRSQEIVERFGLEPWADSPTSELSSGSRRICELAAQVAMGARLLLLDEPAAGVAHREAEALGPLMRRIRDELDCSILIVEHDMSLLMGLCDRIYALDSGRVIADGSPAEIRSNPVVIASYLGTDEVTIARSAPSIDAPKPRPGADGGRKKGARA
ncbi:MAG: ABC transporter permease subunit [Acidimicrobiales bacterium]